MRKKNFIYLGVAALMLFLAACGSGSSSKETYKCGYCGKEMIGGYYDYIEANYACRSCSKELRNK